ncbi:MAG: AMP-binding protein [Clostridia bacterium]|nr:AMP-binding protein [Clostridia bacterium]
MNEKFKQYTDAETFAKIIDFASVTEMWQHSVVTYPDNIAIVDGKEYTYKALDNEIAAFRTVYRTQGVQQGSLVAILSPNSVGFVKAFLAAATTALPAVLLPAHLDAATIFGISCKFGLKAIVYDESLADKIASVKAKLPQVALIPSSATAEEPTPAISVPPETPCAFLFTGGTTGKSKGARLSHRAVLAGTKNGCYGIKKIFEERYLLVLPLTHVFGLIRNLMTALYTGSALYICRNNKDMFRDIAVFKPTILVLVPALAEMAINLSRQFGRNMLGADLKTIICGAAPVAPYLVKEYDKMGITLLPGYGLTESANLVSGNPEALRKPDSVGLIYDGMEYRIVDGELWLKGINMMDGYVTDEDNATSYEDGYFKTGDLVRIDEEGFLYITGRTKEIIVLSTGENVSPAELEVKFYALDVVQDCLVYDTREDGHEMLVLEVLPRAASVTALGITDLESYLKAAVAEINETLPSFERINKIIIRDTDFIRTPAMKIARSLNGNAKK